MIDIELKDLYANLANNIHQELILKGHAIIRVNDIEIGVIKISNLIIMVQALARCYKRVNNP